MGEVYNFQDYKEAKQKGISVEALKKERFLMQQLLNHEFAENLDGEYVVHEMHQESTWPEGYPYVLEEDLDTGYHDDCAHTEWHIVEEGYQAACNTCALSAWSAPW
jgi:hypothetical protein